MRSYALDALCLGAMGMTVLSEYAAGALFCAHCAIVEGTAMTSSMWRARPPARLSRPPDYLPDDHAHSPS